MPLAMLNTADAQAAITRAALNASGELQIMLLESLAESATQHGNLLPGDLTDGVLALVESTTGETALAAAQAHGALTLPTQKAVQMILQGQRG